MADIGLGLVRRSSRREFDVDGRETEELAVGANGAGALDFSMISIPTTLKPALISVSLACIGGRQLTKRVFMISCTG
jgi:hypothetical protein